MTQSISILKHIARVHDSTKTLMPRDPEVLRQAEMIEGVLGDIESSLGSFTNLNYDVSKREETIKEQRGMLAAVLKWMKGRKWLLVDKVSKLLNTL